MSFEPVTFWITALAWLCCSGVWWLCQQSGWWVIMPAILLISLSFAVALVRDLKNMNVQ